MLVTRPTKHKCGLPAAQEPPEKNKSISCLKPRRKELVNMEEGPKSKTVTRQKLGKKIYAV